MTYLLMWVTDNPKNSGFWSNEEYDRIIADCTTGKYISDYDARWDAMHDAERLVMEDAVIAPLYTKANANLVVPSISGIELHPFGPNRVYKRVTIV